MEIVDHVLTGAEFKELGVGATFKYGEEYYIKTHNVETNDSVYNAVALANGTHEFFAYDDSVIPFNCELIVL